MAELATVAAQGHATVLDEASRSQALEVLLGALWPTLGHLRATRLRRELDRENVLLFGVTNEINDSHVGSDFLLLGDQVNGEIVSAQSLLNLGQLEVVGESTGVGTKADAEGVEILGRRSVDERGPGVFSGHLRNAGPVHDTAPSALKSAVARLVAQAALLGVGGALTRRVTLDTAGVAGAGERTLDALVGAVGFVVTNLAAVEAFSSEAAALGLVGTIAREVTGLVAAVCWSV